MPILEVQVTSKDIREGRERSCIACPIALAIKRLLPDAYIEVGSTGVNFYRNTSDESPFYTSVLPDKAAHFIEDFDDDLSIIRLEPFSFSLYIPGETQTRSSNPCWK